MKFKPEFPDAVLPAETLERDYAQARSFGKLRLGERCVYFRKFSGTTYLPYSRIDRAWLRQEEVKARLCCGTANFDQFYVVMVCAGGQECRGHMEDKSTGQACLNYIAAQEPSIGIGYTSKASR